MIGSFRSYFEPGNPTAVFTTIVAAEDRTTTATVRHDPDRNLWEMRVVVIKSTHTVPDCDTRLYQSLIELERNEPIVAGLVDVIHSTPVGRA